MDQRQQTRWRPSRRQILWAGAALMIGVVLIGYRYGITLWDWIKLLVVPAVIAGGGIWFNRQQHERELEIARAQRERDVEIAEQRTKEDRKIAQERAETDRAIANQQRQDDTLQAYLDQIGQLLLDKDRPLRQLEEDEGYDVRTLARARTITVLQRLDGERKANVLQFLYESGLIGKDDALVDLTGADLREAYLREAWLLRVDLSGADLSGADLIRANLNRADLSGARGRIEDQLSEAETLEGATMPNGQKYEDWLKDR